MTGLALSSAEIPDILKIVLKCPEIYSHVLKFLSKPASGASVHL